MKRQIVDLLILFTLATIACAYVGFAIPGDGRIALHVYVLAVGGLAMVALVSALRSSAPQRRRSELVRALDAREEEPPPVSELAKIEREVTLAVGNAYDLHLRLLPQLREIAQTRAERSGRSFGPEALGRFWELLRPDRSAPADRFAPGIRESELRELVAYLERM